MPVQSVGPSALQPPLLRRTQVKQHLSWLTQAAKNMFYKHLGPEATKYYTQLNKPYNQRAVAFSTNTHSSGTHKSCKDLECSNSLFWEKKEWGEKQNLTQTLT